MGDFNMCVDASQSTSEHSIMDNLKQIANSCVTSYTKVTFIPKSNKYNNISSCTTDPLKVVIHVVEDATKSRYYH